MKRDEGFDAENSKRDAHKDKHGKHGKYPGSGKDQYPHNVNCYKWQHGRCSTTTQVITTTKEYQTPGTVTST